MSEPFKITGPGAYLRDDGQKAILTLVHHHADAWRLRDEESHYIYGLDGRPYPAEPAARIVREWTSADDFNALWKPWADEWGCRVEDLENGARLTPEQVEVDKRYRLTLKREIKFARKYELWDNLLREWIPLKSDFPADCDYTFRTIEPMPGKESSHTLNDVREMMEEAESAPAPMPPGPSDFPPGTVVRSKTWGWVIEWASVIGVCHKGIRLEINLANGASWIEFDEMSNWQRKLPGTDVWIDCGGGDGV